MRFTRAWSVCEWLSDGRFDLLATFKSKRIAKQFIRDQYLPTHLSVMKGWRLR